MIDLISALILIYVLGVCIYQIEVYVGRGMEMTRFRGYALLCIGFMCGTLLTRIVFHFSLIGGPQ